jgi:hypothetical protein
VEQRSGGLDYRTIGCEKTRHGRAFLREYGKCGYRKHHALTRLGERVYCRSPSSNRSPHNHVTLVVWANLTGSLGEKLTANTLMSKVLDQIYVVSPLTPQP